MNPSIVPVFFYPRESFTMPNIPYISTTTTNGAWWSNSSGNTYTTNYIAYTPYYSNQVIPITPAAPIPSSPRNGIIRGSSYTAHYRDGVFHREDGPAIEYDNGDRHWYLNGKRHREDGPALESITDVKEWFANDKRHRIDGPAIERSDRKEWWLKGKRHREDGPAVEYIDGYKEWYYQGRAVAVATQDAFNRYVVADKYL